MTEKERRAMHRRIKNRLPPALLARTGRLPLALLVATVTLHISTDAWAKVQTGQATLVPVTKMANAGDDSTFQKSYSKDDLNKKMPANPVTGLDHRIMSQLTTLLNTMAGNFAGAPQQAALEGLKTHEPDQRTLEFHIATLADLPTTSRATGLAIRSFFGSEMQTAVSKLAKSHVPMLNELTAGTKFNLSLGSLFKKTKESPTNTGQMRYGLIVQDIVPDMNAPKQAAIGDIADEMQFAGHAEVKWTIGPVTDIGGRPIFNSDPSVPPPPPPTDDSLFSRVKLPKPDFKGNITPENFNGLAKPDPANPPAWRLDLAQSEDYYNLTYRMKMNGHRLSVEHAFKLPLCGTVELGRRFSDNWKVIETDAYNILYDKRLPSLNIHEMAIEKRYKADLAYAFADQSTVSLASRGKAEGVVVNEADRPEAYWFEYHKTF